MNRALFLCVCVALGLCACVTPQRTWPDSEAEVARRMKAITIAKLDLRQEGVFETLQDLRGVARHARQPVRISLGPVLADVHTAHRDWLAVRKPAPEPGVKTKGYSKWHPPAPKYCEPILTFQAEDISLFDALSTRPQ